MDRRASAMGPRLPHNSQSHGQGARADQTTLRSRVRLRFPARAVIHAFRPPRILSRSAARNALTFRGRENAAVRGQGPRPRRHMSMLYQAYQAHSDVMVPVRAWAGMAINAVAPMAGVSDNRVIKNLTAAYELIARAGLTHVRPPYGIASVLVGNEDVPVHEERAHVTPFGTLLHFRKDVTTAQPRVLLVAPLSGHF